MTTETKPQKPSLLGRLKNAVWVEDAPKQNVQPQTPVVELPQTSGEPTSLDMGLVASNTQDMQQRLEADPQAASLVKFLATLASLEAVIPDETTRYKAALAASGTSKEELLSQAGLYAEVFKQVNDEFIANKITPIRDKIGAQIEVVSQTSDEITSLKERLEEAEKKMVGAQRTIADLQAEIQHDTEALSKAQESVQTDRETLAKKITVFLG